MELAKERLGKRLKELRAEKNLSQQQMADELGISRMAYRYYEAAQRTPDIDFLDKLHEYTGLPMEYLLGRTENTSYETAYGDKELGLSSESISKLRANGPHRDMLDLLIKHKKFEDWVASVNGRMIYLAFLNMAKKNEYPDDEVNIDMYLTTLDRVGQVFTFLVSETLADILKDENVYLTFVRKIMGDEYASDSDLISFLKNVDPLLKGPIGSWAEIIHSLSEGKKEAERNAQQASE